MKIYLAILEDKHVDTSIKPFQLLSGAFQQVIDWKGEYQDEVWIREEMEAWEYYIRSDCDDGPNIRIEIAELV